MTEQTMEIIKALAYGLSAGEIADVMGVTAEDVQQISQEHAADIEERRAALKEAGYLG